jgi:hypothetical protein
VSSTPSVTDWISAIGTAALGLFGFIFTMWQWKASGFKPTISARIEQQRYAVELKIVNTGRAAGYVDSVLVSHRHKGRMIEVDAHFEGFPKKEFVPIALPGLASMRLIIEAVDAKHPFPQDTTLYVGLGSDDKRAVEPVVATGVSLYGLRTVLPPGTSLGKDK